ncbi:MAG TPA: GNAT family N-acetyltransferase, partial [Gaiellaceae bacterium]|nr:GNAT family N-acetyltransferase [Gaiellaceae bacterium]
MIRRATPDDGPAVSAIFVRAHDQMTYLPRIVDEHRPLLGGWFIDRDEIWVDEESDTVTGFAGLNADTLTHIYVDPDRQGCGIGTVLLEHAKSLRSERLELWVFQKNEGARRFYERHGFRLVRLTDG